MKKLIPAIVSDIDGVIVRGKTIIPKSNIVVNNLLQNTFNNNSIKQFKIPFYLLTNGGGCTEQDKANSLNKILHSQLIKKQIFLNFTPLRPIMKQYSQKLVLLSGSGNLKSIAQDCELHKYFTIDEYSEQFDQVQFKNYKNKHKSNQQDQVKQQNFNIEAVFILYDPIKWEESIQSISKLIKQNNNLPIYVVNNDITYADSFRLPRLAFGTFTNALKNIIKKEQNIEPNIIYYGKPTLNTYKYVEQFINQNHQNVGNIYMIGDNPASDIRGANQAGWKSILVKSGIFHDEINDKNDPAQYVVNDMHEAFDLIQQLENIIQNN